MYCGVGRVLLAYFQQVPYTAENSRTAALAIMALVVAGLAVTVGLLRLVAARAQQSPGTEGEPEKEDAAAEAEDGDEAVGD